jgi:hypothetical protein
VLGMVGSTVEEKWLKVLKEQEKGVRGKRGEWEYKESEGESAEERGEEREEEEEEVRRVG